MHVLTKIFIVLVSLLAVMLVPLVVVYAHNENSYKSRLGAAEEKAATNDMAAKAAQARLAAETARLDAQIQEGRNAIANLDKDKAAADATIRQLESQVAADKAATATIASKIETITSTLTAGQQLTESLVNELRELRASAVALERQKVELDEALRDVTTQLDVAEQARRALAEELARLKDQHAATLSKLGEAVAKGFGSDVRIGSRPGITPDKSLTASVIRVQRSNNEVLAEIDAGQKDGVKKDWLMAIGDGKGNFIANLQIISVDVNRATGKVVLEDTKTRGAVQVGMKAVASSGQD